LILGHVTRDIFGSDVSWSAGAPTRGSRLGGAAAFAAGAAALLGIETKVVTAAPSNAPELDELRRLPGVEVAVADSERITTFGHEFVAQRRQLTLIERARPLVIDDVPAAWRSPEVVYVGPVAGECDEALLDGLSGAYGIGCIQGWLRDPVPGRRVRPRRLTEPCRIPAALRAVSFSASDHPGAPALMRELSRGGVRVAVTRGRRGARVAWLGGEGWVPAESAQQVDPTGAGDVFALIFGLSSWAGRAPLEAARRAALAAARVVEGPGLGRLAEGLQALAL
jgi:sugar/nucleoside kinase (ribokinase family)